MTVFFLVITMVQLKYAFIANRIILIPNKSKQDLHKNKGLVVAPSVRKMPQCGSCIKIE